MKIIILYLLGILLVVTGLFFIIINLNLLIMGYTFLEFVKFNIIRIIYVVIGSILLIIIYERNKL